MCRLAALALAVVAASLASCGRSPSTSSPAPSTRAPAPLPPTPWKAAAIAHGGVGSPIESSDGCRAAVDAALEIAEAGGDPVDAAVAGVVVLEDDPRFNAGTGSSVRLDGKSVQMDASVMRSDGRFASVAGIESVKNPAKVARALMDTPSVMLQGDGATRFARTLGFEPYDPTTSDRLAKAREAQQKLLAGDPSLPAAWRDFDWRAHWNYQTPIAQAMAPAAASARAAGADRAHDTVGVAVRATDGRFGVALSTGGIGGLVMRGRVGDVPILGAGLYAGPRGAAAATGTGERIMEEGLARGVHGWLAGGATAKDAAERAVASIRLRDESAYIGIIVVTPLEMAAAADHPMAWAARESGSAFEGP